MSVVKLLVAGVGVVLLTTGALAFQVQQGAGGSQPAAAVELGHDGETEKTLELQTPSDVGKGLGTEVRIPGFGKLGNLPKMDFGLELLYGAAEQRPSDNPLREDPRDDLTIRGSVKHKF